MISRYLVEFRTRKAHRWIVREKDLLRYLICIIVLVIFMLTLYSSSGGPSYNNSSPWSLVCELGEMCFLLFAINMIWHIRNSTCINYNEKILLLTSISLLLLGSISIVILICFKNYVNWDGWNIWIYYGKEFIINFTIIAILIWSKVICSSISYFICKSFFLNFYFYKVFYKIKNLGHSITFCWITF